MPRITFIMEDGSHNEVEAPEGLSVMEIAQKHDIEAIEGACGGGLACATCHLYVHPEWEAKCLPDGEKTEEEEDMLDMAVDISSNSRLSCQIIMSEELDGLVVALPGVEVDEWEKAA